MGLNDFLSVADKVIKPEDVKVILDVGSLHAREAVEFSKKFVNSRVFSFECHPQSYLNCVETTKDHPRCTVVNKAINNYDGTCTFFPIDPTRTVTTHTDGNPGASSLFKAAGTYDHIEKYVQDEIKVPCMRLDTWAKENAITQVDLIWMDLQGAELLALQGMGELLKTVKVIHTEVEINPMYTNQALHKDIDAFLKLNGFMYVWGNLGAEFGTDVIYVKIP
jgi:FkbM family methyltransferase